MRPIEPPIHEASVATLGHATCYQVGALPDREDPVYRLTAGGDVRRAVSECHEHLLRTLVTYAAGSAALTIRFIFNPTSGAPKRQSRLTIMIGTQAQDEECANALRVLIECSDLGTYYRLREVPAREASSHRAVASCHITRMEKAIQPLHKPELNPAIPPVYYVCQPFQARPSTDYLALDRVLNHVTESVLFEMMVEPVDVAQERFVHTRYLARLQSINRTYEHDDEDGVAHADPFEQGGYLHSSQSMVVRPLRRRDPLADDVFYGQRRFHETLVQPHLAFRLRVTAETPAVAQLVGSVVAEAAFKDGDYRLWTFGAGHPNFEQHEDASSSGGESVPPTSALVLGEHAASYQGFRRLAHIATVDELLGAFTLPVASRSSLRCSRKNTEPPLAPQEQLLVLGYDE